MGYDRANRFLQMLEDAGIISEQKKGTKLPRTVNQDKLEEFLNSHGDTGDAAEAASNQISGSSDIPTDTESIQDHDVESPDKIPETQAQLSSSAVSQSKRLKFDFDRMKKMSDRQKFREKSNH